MYDLRPEEGKPSFSNLSKLPIKELQELLYKGLKNQITELEVSPY